MSAETIADRREAKVASEKKLNERFVYQDDEIIEKPFNWKEFGRLFAYMKPYAKQLLPLVILMMILGTITKLSVPFLISLAIDRAIAPATGLPSMTMLYLIAGSIFVLYLIQWAANTYRIKLTNIIGQRVIYDLRSDLFKHIQKLSFNFLTKDRQDPYWYVLRMILTPFRICSRTVQLTS